MDAMRRFGVVVFGIAALWRCAVMAQINSWTNPLSAHWEDPSWSLGVLPGPNQSVFITNSGYKAVAVFASTVSSYANSLTVSNLTIAAPDLALSTLLLNYAGTSVPLRVLSGCEVDTNGTLINDYSALEIDGQNGGALNIRGGTLAEEGGTLLVSNTTHVIGGTLQLTNCSASFGTVYVDSSTGGATGLVTQAGAAVSGDFLLSGWSIYQFLAGTLSGVVTVGYNGNGQLNQYAGTNFSNLAIGGTDTHDFAYGRYVLSGGAVINSSLVIADTSGYPRGDFIQNGGSVQVSALNLGYSGFSQGTYTLNNGVLTAGAFSLFNATFNQNGGQASFGSQVNVAGTFDDYDPEYRTSSGFSLTGGKLTMPSLFVGLFGSFSQSGGSNTASTVWIDRTMYGLSSGVLNASNEVITGGYLVLSDGSVRTVGELMQTGGSNYVANLLSVADAYQLSGGLLVASNITVTGTMSISNSPVVSNSGTMTLGGTLQLLGTIQSFGAFSLSNNSVLDLSVNSSTAAFASASAVPWTTAAMLVVTNWHGNTNGCGASRFIVGSTANGLSSAQLAHISFVNPSGFSPGTYGARILATGEVVPTQNAFLTVAKAGQKLVIVWPGNLTLQSATNVNGPYTDVNGATSPFTNPPSRIPKQFFRLRN